MSIVGINQEFSVNIIRETSEAYLLGMSNRRGRAFWVPKSMCDISFNGKKVKAVMPNTFLANIETTSKDQVGQIKYAIPFGKFKGKSFTSVMKKENKEYFEWMLTECAELLRNKHPKEYKQMIKMYNNIIIWGTDWEPISEVKE